MATKTVTIYSSVGDSQKKIEVSGSTYADLITAMDRQGVQHSSMTAIEGETQHTFESPEAILPETDFTLFLLPKEVKSGFGCDCEEVEDDDVVGRLDNIMTALKSVIDEVGEIIEVVKSIPMGVEADEAKANKAKSIELLNILKNKIS